MENKNTTSNTFGSEQLASKYNLFVTYAKKNLSGSMSYRAFDAANNAFVKAMLKIHTFKGTETQLESWIRTITYNCCQDERRDNKLSLSSTGDLTNLTKVLSYEMSDLTSFGNETIDKKRLWNAFEKLNKRDQKLITYRTLYKWSLEDTAEILCMDRRYVSFYHRRALKKLKELYTGYKFY